MKTKNPLLRNGMLTRTLACRTTQIAPGLMRRRFVEIEPLPLPAPLSRADHPAKLDRPTASKLLGRALPPEG